MCEHLPIHNADICLMRDIYRVYQDSFYYQDEKCTFVRELRIARNMYHQYLKIKINTSSQYGINKLVTVYKMVTMTTHE